MIVFNGFIFLLLVVYWSAQNILGLIAPLKPCCIQNDIISFSTPDFVADNFILENNN